MGIIDIFSKRQARSRGEVPDVYNYDDLPRPLRVQIIHIWMDTLGNQIEAGLCDGPKAAYPYIVNALCKEYGQYFLVTPDNPYEARNYCWEMATFFEREQNVERALDVVELSFQVIDIKARSPRYLSRQNANEIADDAIATLNNRFKEHGVGYRYSDRQIIRIDSEFLHSEAVIPVLRLLNQTHYAGAQDEFLTAHAHYREGRGKEALNECLKAFESVMKTICDRRRWTLPSRPTANTLIQVCFDNNLIPAYLEAHYNALRTMLDSGIPVIRNKTSAHGQGVSVTEVPDHLVAYMLHMTASAIVFLAEADRALGS
jgi:hypothetical protein